MTVALDRRQFLQQLAAASSAALLAGEPRLLSACALRREDRASGGEGGFVHPAVDGRRHGGAGDVRSEAVRAV